MAELKPRLLLLTRPTRLEELLRQQLSRARARFYLEQLGADWADYEEEDRCYREALNQLRPTLEAWGRWQRLDRSQLANFLFAADDVVLALGHDGLVVNALKYLRGQLLVGINPEPARFAGSLLPFRPNQLAALLRSLNHLHQQPVTLAQVNLSDGQRLLAVNDLFIGRSGHRSAVYELDYGGQRERQSSSGLIVSTGLGSGAWLKSVIQGAADILRGLGQPLPELYQPLPWDSPELVFAVREPFASPTSGLNQVFGRVDGRRPLRLRSEMSGDGVIFSDGIDSDFLRFEAGMTATITPAPTPGLLVRDS